MSTVPADLVEQGLEAVKKYHYKNSRVVVLPYSQKTQAIFPEEFLARVYYHLREDGTLPIIFPGMGIGHLNQFLAYLPNRPGLLIPCYQGDPKPHPVGIGWLTEVDGPEGARRGGFGFGYFKEAWGDRLKRHMDLSAMMLKWWFTEAKCDILYGTTINPVAKNYSTRFGFEYLCELPEFFPIEGVLKSAHLICLRKRVFLPLYEQFRKDIP